MASPLRLSQRNQWKILEPTSQPIKIQRVENHQQALELSSTDD